jgi:hypothetical protein
MYPDPHTATKYQASRADEIALGRIFSYSGFSIRYSISFDAAP